MAKMDGHTVFPVDMVRQAFAVNIPKCVKCGCREVVASKTATRWKFCCLQCFWIFKKRDWKPSLTEPHTRTGNCWAVAYECKTCGDVLCDVCHKHGEPRGSCPRCKSCGPCDQERANAGRETS